MVEIRELGFSDFLNLLDFLNLCFFDVGVVHLFFLLIFSVIPKMKRLQTVYDK